MLRQMTPLLVLLLHTTGAICLSADRDIAIAARDHSARSKQIVPVDDKWSGLVVCHGINGMQQWKFKLTEAGPYYVHVYYASATSRPVKLSVNGRQQEGSYLGRKTGSYHKDGLACETLGPFEFVSGKNTLQINTPGHMPHLCGLVISTNGKHWDKTVFRKLFRDPGAFVADEIERMKPAMAETRASLRETVGSDEVLFIKRITYTANHYYSEYLNSKWAPGGGIFILSLRDGKERQVASELEGGVFGRFDLSFDATRILFDWKRSIDGGYRIFEVGVDGKGLRQVLQAPADEAEVIRKYRPTNLNKATYHSGSDDMHRHDARQAHSVTAGTRSPRPCSTAWKRTAAT